RLPNTLRFSTFGAIAVISTFAILLAGCGFSGFQPMYASSSLISSPLNEKLRSVQITTIPGRVGQRIRNELVFQLNEGGEVVNPKYRLDITITERVTSTLVDASGDSSGQIYQIDATFTLTRIDGNEIILKGDSYGRAGFERFSSIFSNVRASRDAQNRAAKAIASDIKSRLEATLSQT
ncbi:MAG: LPS assembly lipoprotein LptE, partial [Pseudomonadota bacterium]